MPECGSTKSFQLQDCDPRLPFLQSDTVVNFNWEYHHKSSWIHTCLRQGNMASIHECSPPRCLFQYLGGNPTFFRRLWLTAGWFQETYSCIVTAGYGAEGISPSCRHTCSVLYEVPTPTLFPLPHCRDNALRLQVRGNIPAQLLLHCIQWEPLFGHFARVFPPDPQFVTCFFLVKLSAGCWVHVKKNMWASCLLSECEERQSTSHSREALMYFPLIFFQRIWI